VILAAHDLEFGYPGHLVGREANIAARPGEALCLLGPNGCGKTTLFKTLLGLLPARSGSVTLDGRDIAHLSPREIALTMGYVPQQHDAYFPFTVLEVVLMGRTARVGLFGTPSPADHESALNSLRQMRIEPLRDEIYTRISGGERQLTLIARALAQEPKILVLDEPTANLDFGNQALVLDHIRRLKRSGMTIVLSTHDPDHAFRCADTVVMMKNGALVTQGETSAVVSAENLEKLYGVSIDVISLPDGRRTCITRRDD